MGSLKHDIEYIGQAWAIALIRISHPACDKSLPSAFQFFPYPLLDVVETFLLFSTHKRWQPQVFFIVLYDRNFDGIFD